MFTFYYVMNRVTNKYTKKFIYFRREFPIVKPLSSDGFIFITVIFKKLGISKSTPYFFHMLNKYFNLGVF